MKLYDILRSPWAIEPEKLTEISDIYLTRMRGDKIDLDLIEAQHGKPLKNEPQGYYVENGAAVIPIHGVIGKRMNLFRNISGGASSELIGRDFIDAMQDDSVDRIILDIDSPGGTVDGTPALADLIYGARDKGKPIIALANGLMASAAYWIGSAADQILITDQVTNVGSIGVVATHRDFSQAENKMGVKTTEVSAGKYKRIASSYEPLSSEARESIQERVDYLYSIFVDTVARNRGVSVETVLENMADGRIFIGQQAIDAGLVDGFSTLDQLLEGGPLQQSSGGPVVVSDELDISLTDEGKTMPEEKTPVEITKAYVLENHPEIANAFIDEGKAIGAQQENERVQAVFEMSMPGHEDLIQELAFDGKTTGDQAAVKVLNAEKQKKQKFGADHAADAAEPMEPSVDNTVSTKPDNLDSLPFDERVKAEWDRDPNIRTEFGSDYDQYLAFRTAEENGQVKILGK